MKQEDVFPFEGVFSTLWGGDFEPIDIAKYPHVESAIVQQEHNSYNILETLENIFWPGLYRVAADPPAAAAVWSAS